MIWAVSVSERKIIHTWTTTSLDEETKPRNSGSLIDCNKIILMPDFTFICACSKGQM